MTIEDTYILQVHARLLAHAWSAVLINNEFWAAHLAVSAEPDFIEVLEAIEEGEENLRLIDSIAEKVEDLTDVEAKTVLLRLIKQQTQITGASVSGLRHKLDRVTSGKSAAESGDGEG